MATKLEAARLLMLAAARKQDAGERADVEAGMAKLFASEICHEVRRGLDPHPRRRRLHDGVPDRALYRDAPLMIIGEGTNEIQRLIVARGLLGRYAI